MNIFIYNYMLPLLVSLVTRYQSLVLLLMIGILMIMNPRLKINSIEL